MILYLVSFIVAYRYECMRAETSHDSEGWKKKDVAFTNLLATSKPPLTR